jgi:type I restriction enzyme R subunit
MAVAGTSDDDKEEHDVILQEFNDKWFKGWDTTPEEQKVKFTAIVNAVKQDTTTLHSSKAIRISRLQRGT